MSAKNIFREVGLPQQKTYQGIVLPKILSPSDPSEALSQLGIAIKNHKPWLESLLHESGALLFRGFPLTTASDFNNFVEAFGFDELPFLGGVSPRTKVLGRVFTANDSPPDQKIPFHHELSHVLEYPTKLFFFCEVEPGSGGETPIAPSHIVYERMKAKHPDFVEKLEEHGLIYMRVIGQEDDPSSSIGRGWKSTFLTEDKSVAEERAAKLGMKLEWMEDTVRTIMGPVPAVKYDPTRERKIWFNGMIAAYTCAQNDPTTAITFGNGKPLTAYIVHDCQEILDEESVAIPWQKGDVLLIDNLAVLHSRGPFDPPRRILVSLCK